MAKLMRRLGICEELGTGWDRVATYCELYLLPAPQIEIYEENTRVIVSAPALYKNMTQDERKALDMLFTCMPKVHKS